MAIHVPQNFGIHYSRYQSHANKKSNSHGIRGNTLSHRLKGPVRSKRAKTHHRNNAEESRIRQVKCGPATVFGRLPPRAKLDISGSKAMSGAGQSGHPDGDAVEPEFDPQRKSRVTGAIPARPPSADYRISPLKRFRSHLRNGFG